MTKKDIEILLSYDFDFQKSLTVLGNHDYNIDAFQKFKRASYIPLSVIKNIKSKLEEIWYKLPEGKPEFTKTESLAKSPKLRLLLRKRASAHASMKQYAEAEQQLLAYEKAIEVLAISKELTALYGDDFYKQKNNTKEAIIKKETKQKTIQVFKKKLSLVPALSRAKKSNNTAEILRIEKELIDIENYLKDGTD